ncbi:MAG: HD-GYP domain-containing protein [Clostridiaceae bacterium]|nr:HD-GYP domain-containing protein [Clostridiaceae bacterium]
MRYVPINYLEEGMILGKTLYGENGEILLREDSIIQLTYLKKMILLGYSGIYIKDELSEDIVVDDVINEELKMKTIKSIKDLMNTGSKNRKIASSLDNIENLISSIIEEISCKDDLIVNMLDLKVANNYVFYHSVNVSVLSLVLGVAMKLNKDDLYLLGVSALLHDIGKKFIPNEILEKTTALDKREIDIVKKHSEDGYRYIKERFIVHTKVYMGVFQHHERHNGDGYPLNIKGENISLFARIIAISDVYDTLTSNRPNSKGVLPSEAMEYIMANGGSMFHPEVVKIFATKIAPYPVGTCVKLSNGSIAVIVENYSVCCLRPLIKVIETNGKSVTPYNMELKDSNLNVTIIGIADEIK